MIEILDKVKCCGCSACEQACPSSCISMKEDDCGFLYPIVDKKRCINCNLCESVCPVINQYLPKEQPLNCYLAKTNSSSIRNSSSSGGVFSELATQIIRQQGVVFGVRFDEKWRATFDYVETIEDLCIFRGSKYIQAMPNSSYEKILKFLRDGKNVLFSGTPCQVAGLKHFLKKDYSNLFTIDIVCHSIPSQKTWLQYLTELERKYLSKVIGVSFRDKSNGWTNYSIKIDLKNKFGEIISLIETHEENVFMKGFLRDLYTRPSCSDCPARNYKSGSDITIADAWGINKYHPDINDEKGLSHILINTEKGKGLFQKILGLIECLEIKYYEVEPYSFHAPITKSCSPNKYRSMFYSHISKGEFFEVVVQKCIKKDEREKKIRKWIKSFFITRFISWIKSIVK